MAYSVDNFSGSRTIVIEDGTVDSSLDIRLIGKNYAGYGEIQNENFFHMLENFAGNTPPTRPVNGQLWYDALTKRIKFYDSSILTWRSTGGVAVGPTAPSGLVAGDLWYNSVSDQLWVNNGFDFTLVGPQGIDGFDSTRIESMTVIDISSVVHPILAATVDGEIIFVVSNDAEFELNAQSKDDLGGPVAFNIIKPGITLVNTTSVSGDTDSNRIFWGSASHSLKSELATASTTLAGGSEKSIPYQNIPGATNFLTANITATRKILSQIGNGTVANAPEWLILPTVLPIAKNNGTILNIPLANGTFPVTTRTGSIVNITVN